MLYQQGLRLGILGGGQLGRMLIQSAIDFDLTNLVLDPDPDAPCKGIASRFHVGSLKDFDEVYRFGKQAEVVTIEIENVNCDALEALEKEGVKVYPQPHLIRLIQDKGLQKQFYREHNIPTADFHLLQDKAELHGHHAFFPAVQKLRREGYDGRGVHKISGTSDIKAGFEQPSVLEKMVDFEKEISVIVARSINGEIKAFPTVELDFHPEKNLVEYLFSPADISPAIEKKAQDIAEKVAESLGIVGLLAVEMFLTKDGQVLVNEIAPRPHNSGHHSIEANITSQYEQHLRAILGMPLGDTDIKIPAVMVNLLGEDGYAGKAVYQGLEEVLGTPGVSIHLYGKKLTKPFRKMGHVTIVDSDPFIAREKARFVKNTLKVIA